MSTRYVNDNLEKRLSSEVKHRAGWGVFMGVLTVILGFLIMADSLVPAAFTTRVLGALLVVVGILELFQSVQSHTAGRFVVRLLLAIGYGIAGVVLMMFPLWGVAILAIFLGLMLLFESLAAMWLAFQARAAGGGGWILLDAVLVLVLAIMVLDHWPSSSVRAIDILVGVAIVVRGITRIALSERLRRAAAILEHDRRLQDERSQRAA